MKALTLLFTLWVAAPTITPAGPVTVASPAPAASLAAIPEGLSVGQRLPDFSAADLSGQPLSLSANRGKVTLVDFWATWCGPCKTAMPQVVNLYRQFSARGFTIIGVSLDNDRAAVVNFTQAEGMSWPQYFDGQGSDNELAAKYGVRSLPKNYLLDRRGVIIGKNLSRDDLSAAVAKAMAGN